MTQQQVSRGDIPALEAHIGELNRWLALETQLSDVAARGGGIAGLVRHASSVSPNPLWVLDSRHRVVARSSQARGSDFRQPELHRLLESRPANLAATEPTLVPVQAALGITRRHLLIPVSRDDHLFAWLVIAEVSARLGREDARLAARLAFHLATEYSAQRRVAQASWNARSTLARQLVRGTTRVADLMVAADYLGVEPRADRVVVYVSEEAGSEPRDEEALALSVADELGVEVLPTRGSEGVILLVEVPEDAPGASFVQTVKHAMTAVMTELGEPEVAVGVSGVARMGALQRAYRETREVVQCIDRFSRPGCKVVSVNDLGPARLFVANSDLGAVRNYVQDVLGALLTGKPGTPDLLRTLQCFFDTGHSVRESASQLGIHENTVRLRLAKIHDLTGLDVASDANDQLSAQTALLVLRLEGHPAIPAFGAHQQMVQKAAAKKDTA